MEIGDKPASFVGSTAWIGSVEVGWVLDSWYSAEVPITARYLQQVRCADMADHAPELADHFANHGTPVMIGGGVLAHTILGVALGSQRAGARRNVWFLVLDPHYAGPESQTAVRKRYCCWKDASFWEKGAVFNLCLLQRPTML